MYFIWGLSFYMYIMALSFTKLFHPALPSLTGRATLARPGLDPAFINIGLTHGLALIHLIWNNLQPSSAWPEGGPGRWHANVT